MMSENSRRRLRILCGLVVFLICMGLGDSAIAQMSIFQAPMFAQLHCPADKIVWLDFNKRRYYSEGQRLYGKGRDGVYVCRQEASKSGYRRSLLGRR